MNSPWEVRAAFLHPFGVSSCLIEQSGVWLRRSTNPGSHAPVSQDWALADVGPRMPTFRIHMFPLPHPPLPEKEIVKWFCLYC